MSVHPWRSVGSLALLALALFLLTNAASAQAPRLNPSPEVQHGAQPLAPPVTHLQAGDALQIQVHCLDTDFTLATYVHRDGTITVDPVRERIPVGGLSVTAAAQRVKAALAPKFSTPEVTLAPIALSGSAFFITGDLSNPGSYPLRQGLTVRQAVLKAADKVTSWCLSSGYFRVFLSCSARISIARLSPEGDVKVPASGAETIRPGDLISVQVDVACSTTG